MMSSFAELESVFAAFVNPKSQQALVQPEASSHPDGRERLSELASDKLYSIQ